MRFILILALLIHSGSVRANDTQTQINPETETQSSLMRLPPELIFEIFTYLDPESLRAVSTTRSQCRALAKRVAKTWKKIPYYIRCETQQEARKRKWNEMKITAAYYLSTTGALSQIAGLGLACVLSNGEPVLTLLNGVMGATPGIFLSEYAKRLETEFQEELQKAEKLRKTSWIE